MKSRVGNPQMIFKKSESFSPKLECRIQYKTNRNVHESTQESCLLHCTSQLHFLSGQPHAWRYNFVHSHTCLMSGCQLTGPAVQSLQFCGKRIIVSTDRMENVPQAALALSCMCVLTLGRVIWCWEDCGNADEDIGWDPWGPVSGWHPLIPV